jgi:hypothetical protein
MADGLSTGAANALLGSAVTGGLTGTYKNIQLHTAAPGAAGTTAVATETSRKAATFAAASGGSQASNVDLTWTSIAGSQDATDFTAWDSVTAGAGNFGWSGSITANPYNAGDTYTIPSGQLTASFTTAS